jgi:hypothetical protein
MVASPLGLVLGFISVIIDYLVRHGHLSPDTPGYLDVVRELRSGACR